DVQRRVDRDTSQQEAWPARVQRQVVRAVRLEPAKPAAPDVERSVLVEEALRAFRADDGAEPEVVLVLETGAGRRAGWRSGHAARRPSIMSRTLPSNPSRARASDVSIDTTIPTTNEPGIVYTAGFLSGNHAVACFRMSTWITGEYQMRMSVAAVPS